MFKGKKNEKTKSTGSGLGIVHSVLMAQNLMIPSESLSSTDTLTSGSYADDKFKNEPRKSHSYSVGKPLEEHYKALQPNYSDEKNRSTMTVFKQTAIINLALNLPREVKKSKTL